MTAIIRRTNGVSVVEEVKRFYQSSNNLSYLTFYITQHCFQPSSALRLPPVWVVVCAELSGLLPLFVSTLSLCRPLRSV